MSISPQLAGIHGINHHLVEQIRADGLTQGGIFNREQRLDAIIQVALHHIGATQPDLLIAAVAKVENTTMFQEASDYARDPDIVAYAGDARAQAADAAHDQVNAHTRLRSAIQQVDYLRINQRIHFENQVSIAMLLLDVHLAFDTFFNALA